MLFWVASNKDKINVQELILKRPSASLNRTPLTNVPPDANTSAIISSGNQDSDASIVNNLWSTKYNRHIMDGNGDCFFSAVNFCMKVFDKEWQHDNISLRNLALTQLKSDVYKNPHFYLHYLPSLTDNVNPDSATIDSIWEVIRVKYQDSGQYVDHDVIMSTVSALNLDIQLHGASQLLLNIEGRIPMNTIHLLYCGLQTDNNRGNHYDALLPKENSNNNPSSINVHSNTQTSTPDDDIFNNPDFSQNTLISEPEPDNMSSSSSSNGSTIYTETLLWKYLDHLTLLPHRKRILLFLNKQNNTISLSKKRKMCTLCFCRFRGLHLHGKSKDSKALCQFLQSIRGQLLPLYLSSLDDITATQTSDITATQTSDFSATQTSDILSN